MILKILAVVFTATFGLHATEAPVQMGDTHLQRIQADLLALQKFIYKRFGDGQDYHEAGLTPPLQNDTYETTQALESAIRDLTQKIESLEEKLQQIDQLERRLKTLEAQQESIQKKSKIDRLTSASDSEFVHFLNTDMHLVPDAEKPTILKLFLDRFPEHTEKGRYLKQLIYALYKDKQFKDTARYAAQFYKQSPDAPDTPDILLLLALSLYELNKTKEACLTLDKIDSFDMEKITPDLKYRLSNARTKCGCTSLNHDTDSTISKVP